MNDDRIAECLGHLIRADDILMAEHEFALAAHLSLVIELLVERLNRG